MDLCHCLHYIAEAGMCDGTDQQTKNHITLENLHVLQTYFKSSSSTVCQLSPMRKMPSGNARDF